MSIIQAEPFPLEFDTATTALVIIDMQRDFVLPGGFGEKLGNDTSLLLAAVGPAETIAESFDSHFLATFRARLGIVNGSWLLYATGGAASARGS